MNAVKAHVQRRRRLRSLATVIAAHGKGGSREARVRRDSALKALWTYSEDTIDLLAGVADEGSPWPSADVLYHAAVMQQPEWRMWGWVYFVQSGERPSGDWQAPGDRWGIDIVERLLGLRHDPVARPLLLSRMCRRPDPPLVEGLTAVLAVEYEIYWAAPHLRDRLLTSDTPKKAGAQSTGAGRGLDGRSPYRLANADLTQLILDRPGDADRIARIALERGTGDAVIVGATLDSTTPALVEGVL